MPNGKGKAMVLYKEMGKEDWSCSKQYSFSRAYSLFSCEMLWMWREIDRLYSVQG